MRFEQTALIVATADPLAFAFGHEVESTLGAPVKPAVATRTDILRAIQTGYRAASLLRGPCRLRPARRCRRCAGNLQPGWRFCPFCASSTTLRPAWPTPAAADEENPETCRRRIRLGSGGRQEPAADLWENGRQTAGGWQLETGRYLWALSKRTICGRPT